MAETARVHLSKSKWVVVVAGALVALVVAVRVRPDVLFDDAAITFRYAARIAEGSGFTFNDGDRTNGASAPLYTLVLALGSALGVLPERMAVGVGITSFATVVSLVGVLAQRIEGRVAAALAMGVLVTSTVFQNQALSGMESGFAAALGLGALVALASRRFSLAGVLVGLALFNRLDALALAAPIVVLAAAVDPKAARRVALAALVTVLPWVVFATVYFGSPIPYSGTQKVAGRAGSSPFDPTWVMRAVTGREGVVVFVLALCLPAVVVARRLDSRLVRLVPPSPKWTDAVVMIAFTWVAIHAAFYSLVDLGAPYPWYTTVVFPVIALGSGVSLARMFRWVRQARPQGRTGFVAGMSALVIVVLLVSFSRAEATVFTTRSVAQGFEHRASRDLDRTRRAAGRFLATKSQKGDVIRTCFGWVAYEALDRPIDESCPLSTRKPVGPPDWFVESPGPGDTFEVPEPSRLVATFEASRRDDDLLAGSAGATYVYKSDSD